MKCPNCNKEIPENSKFCVHCGEKATNANIATSGSKEEKPAKTREESTEKTEELKKKFSEVTKKIDFKKIAALIIALIIIFFGAKTVLSFFGEDHAYAYLSDGQYKLVTDIKKGDSITVDSASNELYSSELLAFGPDEKYVYYYTKIDDSSVTGNLYRAEFGKLKEDPSKNAKYIELISSNVSVGFDLLEDGSLLYKKGDDTLVRYNGKESTLIAKDVYFYEIDDDERLIYWLFDENEYEYTIYGVDLAKDNKPVELASDIADFDDIYRYADHSNILYVKEDENYNRELYASGFDLEPKKLGSDFSIVNHGEEKIYFTVDNDTGLNLYDFVVDEYKDKDADLKEPDRDDFEVPNYTYQMVSDSNPTEDSYDELYTSITKPLYWYGMSTWNASSMQNALDIDWDNDADGVHKSTQEFIDKFSEDADEDGYILVTDEVKSALKKINQFGAEDDENRWLWLTYNKEESGTTTDYDAYNEEYDIWYDAASRIRMREELKDNENNYPTKTLYVFADGELETVHEEVLDTIQVQGGLVFNTADSIEEKISLEEVDYIDDLDSVFEINMTAENYFVRALAEKESVDKISTELAEKLSDVLDNPKQRYYSGNIYLGETDLYIVGDSEELFTATINKGEIGKIEKIADNVSHIAMLDEDTIYFASDSYENGGYNYYNLHEYNNGESNLIAMDVLLDIANVDIYTDDSLLTYTNYGDNYGLELTLFNSKGESTVIGDDVTEYIRVDESTILYVSDEKLYSYDEKEKKGQERKVLNINVDALWSLKQMEIEKTIFAREYSY